MLGVTEALPEWLLEGPPDATSDPADYRLRPHRPPGALHDGDSIDLGDRRLQVLHLPGHSPGSIALLDPDSAILFSGDVVYDDEPLDDLIGSDRPAYVRSMRRLLDLDVAVAHPGHDGVLIGEQMHAIVLNYVSTHG